MPMPSSRHTGTKSTSASLDNQQGWVQQAETHTDTPPVGLNYGKISRSIHIWDAGRIQTSVRVDQTTSAAGPGHSVGAAAVTTHMQLAREDMLYMHTPLAAAAAVVGHSLEDNYSVLMCK